MFNYNMKLIIPHHLRSKRTSNKRKLKHRRKYFDEPLVKSLMQPLSKKNEKFKGVKMTLSDLKTPLF